MNAADGVLLGTQFGYNADTMDGLCRFAVFIVLFHVLTWLRNPAAADASKDNLLLIQRLLRYKEVDDEVANAPICVMRRHFPYL